MLYPQDNELRLAKDLSGIWKFFIPPDGEGESLEWAQSGLPRTAGEVAVPASFNDLFTEARIRDHQGAVWYETEFFVAPDWLDRWVGLRFDSVTHHARVWINGHPAFSHKGGFLPFGGDVRQWVVAGKANRLTVRVDNTLDWTTLPPGEMGTAKDADGNDCARQIYHFDFFNYAGIDRPVRLVVHGVVHVDKLRLTPVRCGDAWSFAHRVVLSGGDAVARPVVEVRYFDEDGQCVAVGEGTEGETRIPSPRLWRPGDAYLYTAEVRVCSEDGALLDLYRETCGLREIKVTPTQYLINGEPFYFQGFGKHEDFAVFGKGLNLPLLVRDFALLEWIGANSVRTTHYPYSEEFLRMADRHGIAVIDECPAVGQNRFKGSEPVFTPDQIGAASLAHHREVMEALIERDYNRPCVVMWCVGNEPATGDPGAEDYYREVCAHTRACDPTRPITLAETTWWDRTRVAQFVDVICINRYFGWYIDPGNIEFIAGEMEKDLRNWHEKFRKPVLVAEYGAEAIPGFRSLPAQMFSEDFQKEFLAQYHAAFDRCEFCIGEHVWNFADFMTKQGLTRVMGNRKGVFTRDRQPKAIAYELKKRWSAETRLERGVRRHVSALDPGDMSPAKESGVVPPHSKESGVVSPHSKESGVVPPHSKESGVVSPHSKESGVVPPHSKSVAWHHAPLHLLEEQGIFMVTAGTLHKEHFFRGEERLRLLHDLLLELAGEFDWQMQAWAVFSNHYHFVASSPSNPGSLKKFLGKLHMKSARAVNQLDGVTGRKVWHQYWDSHITFENSYWPRLRYVQENAVKHGLVSIASQYPWCSAGWFEQTAEPAVQRKLASFQIDQLKVCDEF